MQRVLDDSGIEYDKTMYFNLRHCNTRVKWKSINYLSRLKMIVNPAGNQLFPSLRDIILRTWCDKIPVCVRSTCISIIQELMIVDYVHSLTRMRPDCDIEIINRLARGAQTDFEVFNQEYTFDVTVEFVPPKRGKRKVDDVFYEIALEFKASSNEARHFPYEPNMEDTDKEDN